MWGYHCEVIGHSTGSIFRFQYIEENVVIESTFVDNCMWNTYQNHVKSASSYIDIKNARQVTHPPQFGLLSKVHNYLHSGPSIPTRFNERGDIKQSCMLSSGCYNVVSYALANKRCRHLHNAWFVLHCSIGVLASFLCIEMTGCFLFSVDARCRLYTRYYNQLK